MPIYEYACRSCDHAFETMHKASETPLKDCPECGEPELRKLLSAPVFRLKGSGWYETDFKSGDKKRNLAGDADNGSKGDGDKPAAEAKSSGSGSANAASDAGKSSKEPAKSSAASASKASKD